MLVNCVVYQAGEKVAHIEPKDIHEYLAKPDCFVWVAVHEPDERALQLMQEEFDLHPLAVEDARNGHQRPKVEEYSNCLFAVVQMIEEEGDELIVGEVAIFVGKNYVLSVRTGAKRGFQDVRDRCEREPELLGRGAGYVLYALIDAVVDRYFPVLDHLETQLDKIEEQIFSDASPRQNIESLYNLKQKVMTIRHAVAPLAESMGNLYGARVPIVCAGMKEYFRDIADHLQRLNQTIDSMRETIATATAVNVSMINLQESETMKQLAAYAALIAVPTLIVGIYGMNFEFMPELHWRFGYPLSLAVMAAIDGYLFYRFRKSRWL